MDSNDPVLNFLKRRLNILTDQYKEKPDEVNRYRLATHEELLRRWEEDHAPVTAVR
jgi:hypothetical protein